MPGAFLWARTPQLVDDWMTDLRAVRGCELPVLGAHLLGQLLGRARLLPDQTPTEYGAFVPDKRASDGPREYVPAERLGLSTRRSAPRQERSSRVICLSRPRSAPRAWIRRGMAGPGLLLPHWGCNPADICPPRGSPNFGFRRTIRLSRSQGGGTK